MKPNLPYKPVKKVLVDRNMPYESQQLLKSFGITLIKTIPIENIIDCTATHPDMQFAVIKENTALVCAKAIEYYKSVLPEFNLIPIKGVRSPYPNDCIINITRLGDKCFAGEHQAARIDALKDFELVKVKQGYTKCSICILNENAIITADKSISDAALNHNIRVYRLPDDCIRLSGYSHGFWGGACGLIGNGILFFNGDITRLECENELREILKKEKIEPVYPKGLDLEDNGSIIPLY